MPVSRYLIGPIPWYSALIVTGMVLAIWLAERERRHLNLPEDTVVDLALRVIPLGILGARLYYVIFHWDLFAANLVSVLYIWQGGLAIYGGILGGAAALWLTARHLKLSPWQLADMVIPGVALAQAIGRWGNFFNQEAYGFAVTNPAWQWFPFAVRIVEGSGAAWHLATFFYESVWDLIVFVLLMRLGKRKHRQGDLLRFYLLLYGAGRMVIEGLRLDSLMTFGGRFRISQLLSLGMLVLLTGVFLFRAAKVRGVKALRACLPLLLAIPLMLLLRRHLQGEALALTATTAAAGFSFVLASAIAYHLEGS